MKIVAIGDVHGRNIWKDIVEKEKDADVFVFIGDYFDSWTEPFEKQKENFLDILAFKYDNPEKVKLLLGNHDYQYLPYVKESYSGFQPEHKESIGLYLQRSIEDGLIQACYVNRYYLFSHAGVTKTWYANNYDVLASGKEIEKEINNIFLKRPDAFKFTPSNPLDNTGDSITQPPIWVRPRALRSDSIDGFIQVVGHTHQKRIEVGRDLVFIDVFDNCREYLIIDDLIPSVGKLS